MITIIQDSRENLPYSFQCINPPPLVEIATLDTGDYSLKGFADQIVIERKGLSDCFGTFGNGRKRFERELERMRSFQFAAVVIEGDWHTIFKHPPKFSKLKPKTIHASIIAWQQRYGVHFITCPDRDFAERTTYRILERFWKDRQNGL